MINIIVKVTILEKGRVSSSVYYNITINMACITLDQTLEKIHQFKNLNTVFNN